MNTPKSMSSGLTVSIPCKYSRFLKEYQGKVRLLGEESAYIEGSVVPPQNSLVSINFQTDFGVGLSLVGQVCSFSASEDKVQGFGLYFLACSASTQATLSMMVERLSEKATVSESA